MIMHTCFHLFDPFSSPWILRYKPSLGLFLSWTHPWHGRWGASVWVRIWSIPSTCLMRSAGGHQRNPTGFRSQLGYGWPRVLAPIQLGFIADWIARLTIPGLSFEGNTQKGLMSVKYRISCLQMFRSKRMEKQTPTHSADSWMTFFQEITMQ